MRHYIIYGFLLIACFYSTQANSDSLNPNLLTDTPTPPGKVGEIVGEDANAVVTPLISHKSSSTGIPMVSIMNHSSGVITVWALAPNNWLWGYSPFDSKSFGQLRNWYVLKNANGSVSFRNVRTKTCMAAYKNGIIHSECNRNKLSQQFDLLSLTNGAVALKNAGNQKCLRIPERRSTVYMPITFVKCPTGDQFTVDQQWFIAPPILDSYPIPND
uniref:Cytolethal distending toxin subunit A n=1 Tax=Avibacterium paragallinarum TaxID=728 RepID=W6IBI6_AVIPA|nr:cytolethal distending toxin protein A [Avibacterium paragallinarum]AHJ58639.1 cytolethal distending toxin protein A [Avibacterium paragallinarum]AHJ58645.1 cytolethal distending toxin protein A [Avibacterium paragallinarum]